jgi:pyruvate-ferredoxin/flavodoxin oxidoreductase
VSITASPRGAQVVPGRPEATSEAGPAVVEREGPAAAPRFPGSLAVLDGSEAIASVETRVAEGACAYPITPSTVMATVFQAAVAEGRTNLWGAPLSFLEPESEHSSASAAEGFALSGGRVTNFTAGQGLILMKEVLYVIAGKRLPVVFHVGARALTSQALNIHAGHDDVMGVADTGWGILFARNAQEAADLTAIARRTAEEVEVPFLVVQDGFLTTHTLEDIRLPEDELLREFVGDPREHLRDYLDPAAGLMTGVVQNQDAYMKGRIGQRVFYERLPGVLGDAMRRWSALTGRPYGLVRADRCADASEVIVSMGTMADTAGAVVDQLRREGRRVGALAITAYRPFPATEVAAALGAARAVAVVERTDEPAAADNPLTREVKAALADRAAGGQRVPLVRSVSAGLGSRDVAAADLAAVFAWLAGPVPDDPADRYAVVGIRHPRALAPEPIDLRSPGAYRMRGHSVGGFGSVTTNRLIATIAGELFERHVQAYPRYGSEKKGLPTAFYLTVADEPIREHGELTEVDFVAVHDAVAFRHAAPLRGLADGGTVFVPSSLGGADAIWASLPADDRVEILRRGIRVVSLDSAALALRHAPRPDLAVRMQGIALAGVFLRVSPFAERAGLGREALLAAVRARLGRFFGKRGGAVLDANLAVVAAAYDGLLDVTSALAGGKEDTP